MDAVHGFMFYLLAASLRPQGAASDACRFFHCFIIFFSVHGALISGDSAGCVISVSSTCAVNNLHSRLLVCQAVAVSWQLQPCRIKEALPVESRRGFHRGDFDRSVAASAVSLIDSWASPVWRPWEPSTWLPTSSCSPTRQVGRHLFHIPEGFDWDH